MAEGGHVDGLPGMKPGFGAHGCAETLEVLCVCAAFGVGLQHKPEATKFAVRAVVIRLAIAPALGQLVAGNFVSLGVLADQQQRKG